ncbi:MAG: glycosyltransferase family A protein, partial [Bacteroidota bacterium]
MGYSFIIPAYKSDKTIDRCLHSIQNQVGINQDAYEVIVVLCRPTKKILRYLEKRENIIFITTQKRNRSYSRNLGAQKAKFEYLVFVDSDIALSRNWVNNQKTILNNKLVAASQGSFKWDLECQTRQKKYGFLPNVQSSFFSEYGTVVVTGACIYSAKIFMKIGGFNENVLWHEDLDLSIRAFNMGYALAYNQYSIAYLLKENQTIAHLVKRSFISGFHSGQLDRYYFGRSRVLKHAKFYKNKLINIISNSRQNIIESLIYVINYTFKLLGHSASAVKFKNPKYSFPRNVKPYKGIKDNYQGQYHFGLLYINGQRCLYNPKE